MSARESRRRKARRSARVDSDSTLVRASRFLFSFAYDRPRFLDDTTRTATGDPRISQWVGEGFTWRGAEQGGVKDEAEAKCEISMHSVRVRSAQPDHRLDMKMLLLLTQRRNCSSVLDLSNQSDRIGWLKQCRSTLLLWSNSSYKLLRTCRLFYNCRISIQGNRTIRRQTNSRSVKSRTGQLGD